MADVALFQDRYAQMVRDVSRDQLPAHALWNSVDFIPDELDAPLGKRGGWSYASPALTSVLTGADLCGGVVYAEFSAGAQLVAVVYDSGAPAVKLAQVVSTSSAIDRGNVPFPGQNPIFYRDLVLIPDILGAGAIRKYDGTSSVSNLSATAPTAKWLAVYKDRLAAATTSAQLQRVYFSPAGDPTGVWDTTTSWVDTSGEVTGLWPLRNALLVFHKGNLERIIGNTPPPSSDMSVQPVWDVGTDDIRSAAGTDDFVVFANASGVFLSDGATVEDVTRKGGMSSYWEERVVAAGTAFTLGGGIYRGYYIVTIHGGVGNSLVDAFIVRLSDYTWTRASNITAISFARRLTGKEELYWADYSEPRVNTISGIFTPAAGNKADADGAAVTPVMETRFRRFKGKGRVKHLYLDYDIRDAASDNPLLTMSYVTTPESTSYTTVKRLDGSTSDTFAETTAQGYQRRRVAEAILGCGVKIAQTNNSSLTKIYRLGHEGHEYEVSRR